MIEMHLKVLILFLLIKFISPKVYTMYINAIADDIDVEFFVYQR